MEDARLILKKKGNCQCAYFKSPCTITYTLKRTYYGDKLCLEFIEDSIRRNGGVGKCYVHTVYDNLIELFEHKPYLRELIDIDDEFYKDFRNDIK